MGWRHCGQSGLDWEVGSGSDGSEVGLGWLPGGTLGVGERRGLAEQGAHPIELGAGGGVKPAEATDAVEAGRQDVLEETADQLEGFQVQVLFTPRGAVAIAPAHPAIGEQGKSRSPVAVLKT